MKIKNILTLLALAASLNVNAENKALMVDTFAYDVCNATAVFKDEVSKKSQLIKVADKVTLQLNQYRTNRSEKGIEIATNVICQKLNGASYQGTDQEWASFIQNAVSGLKQSNAKEVKLMLTGDEAKVYPNLIDNKEYDLIANFNGNKQLIKNVAILDKAKNTVYTLSVSGAKQAEKAIMEEFTRLVKSFRLKAK